MAPALISGTAVVELVQRGVRNIAVKGRLKPGVSVEQAAEEVAVIGATLQRSYPETNRNLGLTARTELDARVEATRELAVAALVPMTLRGNDPVNGLRERRGAAHEPCPGARP